MRTLLPTPLSKLALGGLAVALALALHTPDARADYQMCLPGYINGHTTAVNFQPSQSGRGSFNGIRVSELRVSGAGVKIASRGGTVYYEGPLRMGQYIALPTHRDLIWTGYASNKNHGNGICVEPQY
ncbi:hypothetical protein [Roseospirillum parvum]|uniref:Uncharacterized protein n=1 Tax=Roseospirillum parvum TaxID=83401 RepID=A0A1G7UKR9_9PROT|nr:hypothetical protein [Roseospirillum parvum]SDG47811.1 hypothetical protein SAMN05421742_101352 [Roseospirillum parvum]